MKPFTVCIGVPWQPFRSVVVMAQDAAAALLFVMEAVPEACYVSAKAVA